MGEHFIICNGLNLSVPCDLRGVSEFFRMKHLER